MPPPSQEMIDRIPANYTHHTFSHHGLPGVDVALPVTFTQPITEGGNPGEGLYVKVDTFRLGATITTRWFDIWTAAVAFNAMCVRAGAAGIAGVAGGLEVSLELENAPMVRNGSAIPDVNNFVETAWF